VAKWRVVVLAFLLLIVVGFALVVGQLRYDTNYVGYFRSREPAVEDTRFVIRKFGGYVSVRLTVSAPNGEKGYFLRPEALRPVAELESRLMENPDVSYVSSFTSYLAAYNRALDGEQGVPTERAPILAFGRLFRGAMSSALARDFLGEMADTDFTRLTLVVRTYDSRRGDLMYEKSLGEFAVEAQELALRTVGPELKPVVWGPTMVAVEVSQRLAESQISSSLISAALILLLTAVSFRSIKYGLYTVIPTVAGILLSFIVMVAFAIPLDIVTVMFTSVALGLGVDSSIHVLVKYREQRRTSSDAQVVLRNTLRTAGRPIVHTGASLVAGLLVLLASGFLPIAFFGLLLSLAIVTTAAGSLVFLPAILATEMVISGRRAKRRR